MEERMNKEQVISLIESINLDIEDFTILSSSGLVLRGIMETAGDLDIAVTMKGLNKLKEQFDIRKKNEFFYTVTDKIECVQDDMIGKRTKIGNYYCQNINEYLNYLKNSEREKDKLRVALVEEYIRNGNVE